MKNLALITVFCSLWLVTAIPASAQNSTSGTGDFRAASWGQSPQDVLLQESHPPIFQDKTLLIFQDRIQEIPTEVVYFFLENRLIMGFMHLLGNHADLDEYFSDFDSLKEKLVAQLGPPTQENWQTALPDLESDRSQWAEALGFGLIKVETGWLVGNTGVALRLSGSNFQGHLMAIHFSVPDMNAGRLRYRDYFAAEIGVPNQYFREAPAAGVNF